jgi:hypothetical protein
MREGDEIVARFAISARMAATKSRNMIEKIGQL